VTIDIRVGTGRISIDAYRAMGSDSIGSITCLADRGCEEDQRRSASVCSVKTSAALRKLGTAFYLRAGGQRHQRSGGSSGILVSTNTTIEHIVSVEPLSRLEDMPHAAIAG
jgi:hypothetical protein